LRQINENVDGYEPEGPVFESPRAHHSKTRPHIGLRYFLPFNCYCTLPTPGYFVTPTLAVSISIVCRYWLRCFDSDGRGRVSPEIFSVLHKPQY
jgi:hypothetical protein